MKKIIVTAFLMSVMLPALLAQGYKVGDKAMDFRLKNVDGKMVSMSDYPDARGFVVIFTCNACPYAVAYQDRIIAIDKQYKTKGFPVIAINPNDPAISPKDSYEEMIVRAREKSFSFPYLFDEKQEVYPVYGATRTPHVFLLEKGKDGLTVAYIGTIDDNYQDEEKVKETYLASAIESLLAGKSPSITETKAIGCTIKTASK